MTDVPARKDVAMIENAVERDFATTENAVERDESQNRHIVVSRSVHKSQSFACRGQGRARYDALERIG
jgi:hypothetical protein